MCILTPIFTYGQKEGGILFLYLTQNAVYDISALLFLRHVSYFSCIINLLKPLNPELNPICYLLALLAHHFLHVSRIRVKSLTLRLLMSYIYIYIYIYGAPILDVSRSYTTTQHSR